jgi:hypothetical protein
VPRPRAVIGAIAVGLLLVASGCGGSDDKASSAQTETNPNAEVPPPALHHADRKAYAELTQASGALRSAAVPVAYGSATRIVVAERLDAEAADVLKEHPDSAALRSLRKRTLAALRLAGSPAAQRVTTAKQIARDSIAKADRIDDGLRRYAATNPAANDLTPGSGG